jgi:hypothetical protein
MDQNFQIGSTSMGHMYLNNDSERKFPMEAHKIYANKIARGLISEGIYKASQVDVIPKKY